MFPHVCEMKGTLSCLMALTPHCMSHIVHCHSQPPIAYAVHSWLLTLPTHPLCMSHTVNPLSLRASPVDRASTAQTLWRSWLGRWRRTKTCTTLLPSPLPKYPLSSSGTDQHSSMEISVSITPWWGTQTLTSFITRWTVSRGLIVSVHLTQFCQ